MSEQIQLKLSALKVDDRIHLVAKFGDYPSISIMSFSAEEFASQRLRVPEPPEATED